MSKSISHEEWLENLKKAKERGECMTREREHRFINNCVCEASKYLLLSQNIYPCDYDLNVVDVHEDKEHNLVCLIYVDSDIEEIGSLAFRFTETSDYINGPIYEVFERL